MVHRSAVRHVVLLRDASLPGILVRMCRLWPVLTIALTMLIAGCGASQTSCLSGETCVCSSSQPCSLLCPSGGCEADCVDSEACYVDCPGGGCTVKGSTDGLTNVVCSAGDCTVDCMGTGQCAITACMADCDVVCNESAQCTNACTDPSCELR